LFTVTWYYWRNSSDMKSDRLKRIFAAAASEGVVIPAFNVFYPPVVEAIIEGLKANDAFGLVEVSRIEIEKFACKSVTCIADEYKKHADPSIACLHLDHIPVIDEDNVRVDWKPLIQEGIDTGYDSVMIDASRLPFDENVAVVAEVVRMGHDKGVLVEAELGAVLGHESGPMPPYDELFESKRGFTDPDQAREFVEKTGVDWLSVSIGSVHGPISGAAMNQAKIAARLDIDHLKRIRAAVGGIPIVLHGGSGVQQSYVLEAIKNGLVKINIGTDIRKPYDAALAAGGSIADGQAAVVKTIGSIINDTYGIKGSASRLRKLIGE
jgi:ketose-bisphosphate aldolase